MDLRKLPPSMLLTLGLACTGGKSSDDTSTVSACLSPPSSESETDVGPCLSEDSSFTTSTSTGTSTSSGTSGSSGADSTFGPCLSPPEESTTGTGTDTDSMGTSTGAATGTTGAMGDEPPTRAAAIERVLERGTLPDDVAARLRARREQP